MSVLTTSRCIAITLGILLSVAATQPASAGSPRTRWVDDDGRAGAAGCDATKQTFRRIQAAIDASNAGDTVVVCPGTYRQNLRVIGSDKRGLRIRGAVPGKARVRAPQAGGVDPLLAITDTGGVRVAGLVFQAPTSAPCRRVTALIRVEGSSNVRIADSSLEPVGTDTLGACGFEDGVDIVEDSSATVNRVTIRDFQLNGILALGAGTSAAVEDSTILYTHATEDPLEDPDADAIEMRVLAATVRGTTIRGASTGGLSTPVLVYGIDIENATSALVAGNTVSGVTFAILVATNDGTVRRNTVRRGIRYTPTVPSVGLFLNGATADVHHNRAQGHDIGIRVEGKDMSIHDNDFRGNRVLDCQDVTTGVGTAGTANFWTANLGATDDPDGICEPT